MTLVCTLVRNSAMFMGVPSGVKTGSRRDTAYEGTNGDPAETLYGGYTSGYELAPKANSRDRYRPLSYPIGIKRN